MEKTRQGDSQRIFATVLSAIKEFIKKYNPSQVLFVSVKSQDSHSRESLYNRLARTYAGSLGYTLDIKDTTFERFYVFKKIQKKTKTRSKVVEAPITNRREDGDVWGLTPMNATADYYGLRVLMRPSKFLALALPLGNAKNPEVEQHVSSDGNIASAFLSIKFPDSWLDNSPDFLRAARVIGHEGRNRMTAWQKIHGDEPVEVHLFPMNGLRRRDITPEMIREIKRGLHNEESLKPGQGKYITNTFEKLLN
jgi:hypothetical protein